MPAEAVLVSESCDGAGDSILTMASTTNSTGILPRKSADTKANLHPYIRERWSPRAFQDRPVAREDLKTLLEAARWAPSSSNEQPWRFIVAPKEDRSQFERALSTLVEFNQEWARNAPVLILAVAKKTSHSGGENRWARHDLGLALGSLVFQAAALGLHVHMMAGFSAEKAQEVFHIPDDHEAVTAVAIGYLGDPNTLSDKLRERELAPRTRKPLGEIAFSGDWNQPAFTSESD
jgi:nitroreductase